MNKNTFQGIILCVILVVSFPVSMHLILRVHLGTKVTEITVTKIVYMTQLGSHTNVYTSQHEVPAYQFVGHVPLQINKNYRITYHNVFAVYGLVLWSHIDSIQEL